MILYSDFELKSVLIHLNHQSIIYLVLSFYLTDIIYILYTISGYNKSRWKDVKNLCQIKNLFI